MRNPFKTVYCKDCEYCMLATKHKYLNDQLIYARCSQWPEIGKKNDAKRVGYSLGSDYENYHFCTILRRHDWCFSYREAEK